VTLYELLADPARRDRIVADCVRIVDDEVAAKGGLSGRLIRAGYASFQKMRPGIVAPALTRLLPMMAPVIQTHWDAGLASGDADAHFRQNSQRIAEDLLGVTDGLAARSDNRVLTTLYRSLRPAAKDPVATAVPRLPALLRAHT
jgi:hypothetical protein